jgi:hypothetical protein
LSAALFLRGSLFALLAAALFCSGVPHFAGMGGGGGGKFLLPT